MVLVSNYEDTRKEGKFNNFIVIRILSLWVSANAFIFIVLVLLGVFELLNIDYTGLESKKLECQ